MYLGSIITLSSDQRARKDSTDSNANLGGDEGERQRRRLRANRSRLRRLLPVWLFRKQARSDTVRWPLRSRSSWRRLKPYCSSLWVCRLCLAFSQCCLALRRQSASSGQGKAVIFVSSAKGSNSSSCISTHFSISPSWIGLFLRCSCSFSSCHFSLLLNPSNFSRSCRSFWSNCTCLHSRAISLSTSLPSWEDCLARGGRFRHRGVKDSFLDQILVRGGARGKMGWTGVGVVGVSLSFRYLRRQSSMLKLSSEEGSLGLTADGLSVAVGLQVIVEQSGWEQLKGTALEISSLISNLVICCWRTESMLGVVFLGVVVCRAGWGVSVAAWLGVRL